MDNRPACQECLAIARVLHEVYADAWISGDQAFREAWIATYQLIGGTEEDFTRAEGMALFPVSAESKKIDRALLNKFAHQAHSGHQRDFAQGPARCPTAISCVYCL
jgi:hypothetical protein